MLLSEVYHVTFATKQSNLNIDFSIHLAKVLRYQFTTGVIMDSDWALDSKKQRYVHAQDVKRMYGHSLQFCQFCPHLRYLVHYLSITQFC